MTLVTHMRGGERCGSEGESGVANEGLLRIHPPPTLYDTQQYSICEPLFSSFIVAEAWWRGKYRVIVGNLTLKYS